MKLTIIGTGLIGGSIALKLREKHFIDYVYGVDQNDQHLAEAKELGIIDEGSTLENAIQNSDLIILAIPVDAARKLLPSVLDLVNDKQTVMDVGSTKGGIVKMEAPIAISNVMLWDAKSHAHSKITKTRENGKLIRTAIKSGEVIK